MTLSISAECGDFFSVGGVVGVRKKLDGGVKGTAALLYELE